MASSQGARSAPELGGADIGPANSQGSEVQKHRWKPFPTRTLALVLAVVWASVLLDPQVGPFILMLVAAFGIALLIMAVAMGLGILGFGFAAVSNWMAAQIRRATHWRDE